MTRELANTMAWLWLVGATGLVAASGLASGTGCGMSAQDGGGYETTSVGGMGGGIQAGGAEGDGGIDWNQTVIPYSDQCPGPDGSRPHELDVPASVNLEGWTGDSADDYSSFCGGGANGERPDVVYSLQTTGRGTLTLSAASSADQPVVYVESDCGVRTTFGLPPDQLPCLDTAGQPIRLGLVADQEFYVIVEGGGADGSFLVDLDLAPPICGDGVINPANDPLQAEQCDPGPGGAGGAGGGVAAADGCDDNCRFEVPVGDEDKCPGIPATVGQAIQGHTLGFGDDYQPACAPAGGPDRLYFVALQQGEQLHLSVAADFDVVLAVMQECAEQQPSHCQDSSGVSKEESLDFTAPATDTYIIVIDGYDGASWGTFSLTATKS